MQTTSVQQRPPIVVIMGHIDHGKSTLLDTIRNTNIVAGEAGGITQHLSAYTVTHTSKEHGKRAITFLDTPGHAAFQKMRLRGADVADIAVLIVSAEDGVRPQTLEALEAIRVADIPFIVAINKIDKPNADLVRTQASLIENEIFIEGLGGNIPWVAISAKQGTGIDELLDTIILSGELAELSGDPTAPAEGTVIEGYLDKKRGTTATVIVKNGTLRDKMFVVSETSFAPVRIMEDCHGKTVREAGLSEPVGIVGWDTTPRAGAPFVTVTTKKEAEKMIVAYKEALEATRTKARASTQGGNIPVIPVLIKTDALGSIDAVIHELDKLKNDRVQIRVVDTTIGDITQTDVQNISATENAIIIGFNVKIDRAAEELSERLNVAVASFTIIYNLVEWIEQMIAERTPKQEEEVVLGTAKVLKHFSSQKNTHVVGCRIQSGALASGNRIKITRRDILIGGGKIGNMQQHKTNVTQVSDGEFGMQIETRADFAEGDVITAFTTVIS